MRLNAKKLDFFIKASSLETEKRLAEESGIPAETISRWRCGHNAPHLDKLEILISTLNKKLEEGNTGICIKLEDLLN